jgi:hypothetical protein
MNLSTSSRSMKDYIGASESSNSSSELMDYEKIRTEVPGNFKRTWRG